MPMRLSRLASVLSRYGIELETGTKHFKFRGPGRPVFPVPAHNGKKTMVPDAYIRGVCRHFDLNPDEIKNG